MAAKGFTATFKKIPAKARALKGRVMAVVTDFYENKLPRPLRNAFNVLKKAVLLFNSHDTSTLGAGLTYYMVFSIAPMLMIIISVTGAIFGPDAVSGTLKQQIQGLLGSSTANALQEMVKGAYRPGKNWIATAISIILLITGAVGVFDQLRSSLNVIWDVKPGEKKPFLRYLIARLFSFGMIACMALLLLVSLVIHTMLAVLSGYLDRLLPQVSTILLYLIELVFSFGVTIPLFAFIYKFMSDIKIKWRSVWLGALFTAFLFALGKYAIGLYVSKSNIANSYGAAGSLIVLLLWVYYSAQIIFFGAEFTRALAEENGIVLKDAKQS